MTLSLMAAEPFSAIVEFFEALSDKRSNVIRAAITSDFSLLERGRHWDSGRLIAAVQGDYERANAFHVIELASYDDWAWVSYWNRARLVRGGREAEELLWLESAVLSRIGEAWKVRMMHSTETSDENLPDGTAFVSASDLRGIVR